MLWNLKIAKQTGYKIINWAIHTRQIFNEIELANKRIRRHMKRIHAWNWLVRTHESFPGQKFFGIFKTSHSGRFKVLTNPIALLQIINEHVFDADAPAITILFQHQTITESRRGFNIHTQYTEIVGNLNSLHRPFCLLIKSLFTIKHCYSLA